MVHLHPSYIRFQQLAAPELAKAYILLVLLQEDHKDKPTLNPPTHPPPQKKKVF